MIKEILHDRVIITIAGDDVLGFLQGIVTCDVRQLSSGTALYGLMLTPQGKFLHDFFIVQINDVVYLDCDFMHVDELIKKLSLYKLRRNISFTPNDNLVVMYSSQPLSSALISYQDPRLESLGYRSIVTKGCEVENDNAGAYLQLIYQYGVPLGYVDLIQEKSFPLEYGLDLYNAISFDKGCYIGQELTSRTKFRGVVRKALYRVTSAQSLEHIISGAEIYVAGVKIGVFCSAYRGIGKVLLNQEKLADCQSFLVRDSNEIEVELHVI